MVANSSFFQKTLIVVFTGIVLLLLWTYRHWFLIALLSVIIAVGLSIPTNALRRRGVPRGFAVTLSAVGFFLIFTFLLLWIVPTFITQTFALISTIPEQFPFVGDLIEDVLEEETLFLEDEANAEDSPASTAEALTGLTPRELVEQLWTENQQVIEQALALVPRFFRGAQTVGAVVGQTVLAVFLAILFLATPYSYVNASLYLVPKEKRERTLEIWQALYKTLTTWLSALSISISVTVTLVWVVLGLIIGMPNALLVAVIAGIATFIPNIGNFIPLLPIAIFSLSASPTMLFITLPAYLLIQLFESNVITPLVVKAELNLPPAALLLFQVIAGLIFGFLGVLMAVPILAMLITLVRELYSVDVLGHKQDQTVTVVSPNGELTLGKAPAKKPSSGPLSFWKRKR